MKTKESMFDYLKRTHSKVQIFDYFGGNTFQRLYSFCITEHVSVFILPKQRYKSKSCLWLSCLIFDNFFAFILLSWCVYIVILVVGCPLESIRTFFFKFFEIKIESLLNINVGWWLMLVFISRYYNMAYDILEDTIIAHILLCKMM